MENGLETTFPACHTTEEILSHPQFPVARDAMIQAMLDLYEHETFLNRLLLEVGRNLIFVIIMCLDARYDEADRSTWPTLQLVKQTMAGFGLASPRRVVDLVTRLIQTGYIEQVMATRDRRVRILRPTEKMIVQDQDWLVSHYTPLQVMFPSPGYAPIMQRDKQFQRKQRLGAASLFPHAAQLLARNPLMLQFMMHEAGMMIVIKLMKLAHSGSVGERQISYHDLGERFGVSRTQVRHLLQMAERDGLVLLSRGSTHRVQLTPKLTKAFDHFIADTMSGHDLVYELALRADPNARTI